MPRGLKVGGLELFWMGGGTSAYDGGTMFGAVPKALWSKRLPADEDNYIEMRNAPILVRASGALVVIETGLGNKLTVKQKKIYRLGREWSVPGDLVSLGLARGDVTHVVLTHCDFDHAGGIVMLNDSGEAELTFPNAEHLIQRAEWEDVVNPNERASHSYWPVNFTGLTESGKLRLLEGDYELTSGIRLILTGGHTRGHQVVSMESGGESALHLADLLPTHVHFNPLWVTAYDNFPLDAIERKQELERMGIGRDAWFTFYHDPFMLACRFDEEGNVVEKFEVQESL